MRAAQPFAMRYPLVEVEGSYGNLMESGNWAAPRYTSSRLSEVSNYLFEDIEKNTVEEWRDNYDDTEQYPTSLPTKGFYNIVNGTMGIGIGMSSSIPQFNIRDVNNALIKLLWNPAINFEELYCAPDFATGGILLNEEEIKESLKNGTGKSCKLRSVVEYDPNERCLIVSEIPYSVYTNTICGELEKLIEDNMGCGIDRFIDLTAATPNIKIYLTKTANPSKVLKLLFKNTSLQSYYSINMTMLEDGRFPRVFGWKEALQCHLNHEKEVYRKGYLFDLDKLEKRLHIVEGILIALAKIEEVIQVIKESSSTAEAKINLVKNFLLSEIQAKAILEIKLARLANLEVEKFRAEKESLLSEIIGIKEILEDETLFKKKIEEGLRKAIEVFSDSRRTKILNVETEESEPIEEKKLIISLSNLGNIYTNEVSSLVKQRRGAAGSKLKLEKSEHIVQTISDSNLSSVIFFSNLGRVYSYNSNDLPIGQKINIFEILKLNPNEKIISIVSYNETDKYDYIYFITESGMIKKSLLSEYKIKNSRGIQGIKLKEQDILCTILFGNNDKIGMVTKMGYYIMFDPKDITPIGRIAMGVKGPKLSNGDSISDAHFIPKDTVELISISESGLIKRTDINEFNLTGRNVKGVKIQKTDNSIVGFVPIVNERDIIVTSTAAGIRIPISEISKTMRGTLGVKSMKIKENSFVVNLFAE